MSLRRTGPPARSAPLQRTEMPRERRPLRPVSTKRRKVLDGPYAQAKAEVKARAGGRCELATPVCVGAGVEPHHLRGRVGDDLCDVELMAWACRPCHDYVEENRAEAYARGWLLRRNGKDAA